MTTPFIPLDGRITSLALLNISLTGSEVMEIISPGNAELGDNYQVTTAVLGAYFSAFPYVSTIVIKSGATLATPFPIPTTATRILLDKTIASDTYLVAPLAASMLAPFPVFIKDLAGNANTNNININFTGGELCDGLSTMQVTSDYGWVTINPVPSGGAWYMS
jgi:hypothetical protein